MCIQDYALAQNQFVKSIDSAVADNGSAVVLPASKNRVRILVSFDSFVVTNSYHVRVFKTSDATLNNMIAQFSGIFPAKISIFDIGSDLQERIWITASDDSFAANFYVSDIWNNIPDDALLSYQNINPKGK